YSKTKLAFNRVTAAAIHVAISFRDVRRVHDREAYVHDESRIRSVQDAVESLTIHGGAGFPGADVCRRVLLLVRAAMRVNGAARFETKRLQQVGFAAAWLTNIRQPRMQRLLQRGLRLAPDVPVVASRRRVTHAGWRAVHDLCGCGNP